MLLAWHQILVDIGMSKGSLWMVIDGARCSYVFNSMLFCVKFTDPGRNYTSFCVFEQNRPTPVTRRLSLTHAGIGKLNPGGVGMTSLIMYGVKRRFLATPCSIYILHILLHWCLTGRGCSAISVQRRHKWASSFKFF